MPADQAFIRLALVSVRLDDVSVPVQTRGGLIGRSSRYQRVQVVARQENPAERQGFRKRPESFNRAGGPIGARRNQVFASAVQGEPRLEVYG